jgi:hypothetical protein
MSATRCMSSDAVACTTAAQTGCRRVELDAAVANDENDEPVDELDSREQHCVWGTGRIL